MFLHEVSRRISREWPLKVDGEEYERLVRERSNKLCPYCPIRRRSGSAPLETFVLGRICGFLEEEQRCLDMFGTRFLSPLRGLVHLVPSSRACAPGLHSYAASRLTRFELPSSPGNAENRSSTHLRLRPPALRARTHPPQKLPRINPKFMSVVPFEFQGVLPHRLC
jgi:hypothetical protein